MDEAEAYSVAGRASAKKRWVGASSKKRHVQGRRLAEARAPVVTEPRTQDTRLAQVFGTKTPEVAEAERLATYARVAKLMAKPQEDWPTSYFGRELQRSLLTLQDYARQFDDEGQREKAVQIHLVLVKHLKELANESQPLSSEERAELERRRDAEMEAEFSAMTDEELALTRDEPWTATVDSEQDREV
jgi:hypothetical protein